MVNKMVIIFALSVLFMLTIEKIHAESSNGEDRERRANLDSFLSQMKSDAALAGRMRFGKRSFGKIYPVEALMGPGFFVRQNNDEAASS